MEKKALDEALVKVYKEIHKEIKFMDINNNLEPDKQRDSEEKRYQREMMLITNLM